VFVSIVVKVIEIEIHPQKIDFWRVVGVGIIFSSFFKNYKALKFK
jgi:hypothetical protein